MNTVKEPVSQGILRGNDLLDAVKKIGPSLSQSIEEEENNRRLSSEDIQNLRKEGLLKLYLPASLGGTETDPVATATLVEEVARYNTAAGWSMMVANTSAWWCSTLSEKGVEEVFKYGPDTFISGAFHPPMKATPSEGGFIINGRSPLTSNIHEAHWVFVTAFVMDKDQVKMNNGIPEIIGVFLGTENFKIIDTWYTIGMRATDSNDVSAENVFVPGHLTYPLIPDSKTNSFFGSPLYKFPAIGTSISSLIAPVALAVARNAIEELKMIADKKVALGSTGSIKVKGTVQKKLGMAEAMVQSAKAYLHEELGNCWIKTLKGDKCTLEEKARLLLAATHTIQSCHQATDMMYSAAGTTGIYLRSKLAHYFADAEVIRQHGFGNDSRYETAAQVYFGLQPDVPVIVF